MSGNDNSAIDPYVERNLSVGHIEDWLNNPQPRTRLRSVVGPPGCGKTTFLQHVRDILCNERGRQCCVLFLSLEPLNESAWTGNPGPPQPESLCGQWLGDTVNSLGDVCQDLAAVPGDGEFQSRFERLIRILCQRDNCQPPLLLLDAFDELRETGRERIEQAVVFPFLFPQNVHQPNTRVVIARRDQYGLHESALKWEDAVFELEPLGSESEREMQVKRRLQYLLQPEQPIAWAQVPVEARSALRALGKNGIVLVVERLRDSLTPNPFINVFLLERQLTKPDVPLSSEDYHNCLTAFVERAGLDRAYVMLLIDYIRAVNYEPFLYKRFTEIVSEPDRNRLIEKSIVSQIPDTGRFQFEGAVVHLVRKLHQSNGNGEEPR